MSAVNGKPEFNEAPGGFKFDEDGNLSPLNERDLKNTSEAIASGWKENDTPLILLSRRQIEEHGIVD